MRSSSKIAALLTAAVLAAGLGGCAVTTTSLSGSRHTLYESVEELAGDSSNVVRVKVLEQSEVDDGDLPYTVSRASVQGAYAPKNLGRNVTDAAAVKAGDEIYIRQFGTSKWEEVPAQILDDDAEYLLFVTPTMLKGAESEYYITGGSAGIYKVTEDGRFDHGPFEEGDTLPEVLTEQELSG